MEKTKLRRGARRTSASDAQPSLWQSLVLRGVPPQLQHDPSAYRRSETGLSLALVTMVAVSVYGAAHLWLFPGETGRLLLLLNLCALPACAISMVISTLTYRLALATHLTLGYMFVCLSIIAYSTGGAFSSGLYWLLALPTSALLILGARPALFWWALCLTELAAYGLFGSDAAPVLASHDERLARYWLLNASAFATVMTAFLVLFERSRLQATERLRATNADLEAARDLAHAANEAKTVLLTNMSHEIRTPLTAILGFADLLLDTAPAAARSVVSTVRRNGQHLVEIVDDLLDLTRLEAGELEIARARFSPERLVLDVVELMRVKADAHGLELVAECARELPAEVEADPVRLRQILVNLLGNAIKFTDQGRVVLRAGPADGAEPALRFDVIDSGVGLSAEELERVFEPFEQAGRTHIGGGAGTGLGLAICRRLTNLLGGSLHATSEPGRGSTFSIVLPIEPLVDRAPREAAPRVACAPRANAETLPLPCRILVVDDSADNRRLVSQILRRAGADVTTANDGQQAIDEVRIAVGTERAYDLVLMDIQMPVLDGHSATRELRRAGHHLPIVALTAHALREERERCLESGFDDYTTKPIDRGRLLGIVATHLVRSQSGAGVGRPSAALRPEGGAGEPTAPGVGSGRAAQSQREQFWNRVETFLLPPDQHADREERRNVRFVARIALTPLYVAPILSAVFWGAFPEVGPLLVAGLWALAWVSVAVLLLLRFGVSIRLTSNVVLACAFTLIGVNVWFAGGVGAPASFWNVLLPMAATALAGGRSAKFWLTLCVAEFVGLWVLESSGHVIVDYSSPDWLMTGHLVSVGALSGCLLAMLFAYERSKQETLQTAALAARAAEVSGREAERAHESKSQLLASISHDLRTPMTAILGFTELLSRDWQTARADEREALDSIRRNAQGLLGTINDLLTLSKLEANKVELEQTPFSPATLLRELVERFRERAERKGLHLQLVFDTPLPAEVVEPEAGLEEILSQLLDNAIKFTFSGDVELHAALFRKGGRPHLFFRVLDTGAGFSEEQIGRLFESFHQGDSSLRREHGGAGLGLAICRELAVLMGGTLTAKLRAAGGSAFRFAFAIGPFDAGRLIAAPEDARAHEPWGERAGSHDLCGRRFLIVDDSADNRRLIGHLLSEAGAEVETAEDGATALERVDASEDQDAPFDAVLMDLEMPVMDGREAARRLRADGYASPIFALTAHREPVERERALTAGCSEVLAKPIDVRTFAADVLRALDRNKRAP